MFWRKKPQNLQFWSTVDYLNDPALDFLRPQPASKFFPEWMKSIPKQSREGFTAKQCPAFAEFLTQGYVIPLWQDYKIKFEQDGTFSYYCRVNDNQMKLDAHPNWQYIDHLPKNHNTLATLKFLSPWRIKTPKGWSCYQMPFYYHFFDWHLLPGSIRTDQHYEITAQVAFPKTYMGKEITITQGTPISWYIPYKRETLDLEHIDYDPAMTDASWFISTSKFSGGYMNYAKKDKKDSKKG